MTICNAATTYRFNNNKRVKETKIAWNKYEISKQNKQQYYRAFAICALFIQFYLGDDRWIYICPTEGTGKR